MTVKPASAPQTWLQWRSERERVLAEPHGWLTPVALHWLDAEPAALPGLPGHWWVTDEAVLAELGPADEPVRRDGVSLLKGGAVVWRRIDPAPQVDTGRLRLELLTRDGSVGLRVRDPESPARTAFTGVPVFDYDPEWTVTAAFDPAPSAERVTIDTVIPGRSQVRKQVGRARFTKDGTEVSLLIVGSSSGPTLLFRDLTSGVTTYPALRSLAVEVPPDADEVVLDFNKAVNMPCAFTDYCTCPLPPPGNTIPLSVEAGEKKPGKP